MEGLNLNLSGLKASVALKIWANDSKKPTLKVKKPAKNAQEKGSDQPKNKSQKEKPTQKSSKDDAYKPVSKRDDSKQDGSKQDSYGKNSSKKHVSKDKSTNEKPAKSKKKGGIHTKEEKVESFSKSNDDLSPEALLRKEALALGAAEEDLLLVAGLDGEESETEFSSGKSDFSLKSDVSKFINGLGLGNASMKADEDDTMDVDTAMTQLASKKELKSKQKEKNEVVKKVEESKQKEKALEPKKAKPAKQKTSEVKPTPTAKKESASEDSDKVTDFNFVSTGKLVIESRVDWYNIECPKETTGEKLDRFAVERLMEKGQAVLDLENKTYLQEFVTINSQKKFLSQILSDGTLNDKISALTLLVQEAPVHNIKAFDTLLSYCGKKSRTAALQAINAMADLAINGLLPDRKLVAFDKELLTKNTNEVTLALYLFEDHLKKSYFKFIQILETMSLDSILHVRMNAVQHIFDLLKAKPEQEANLLRLGINKLGDKDNMVSAKTSYQILQLEEAHPAMKKVIISAVVHMVLQKSTDYHSQYYTILTLNQTILSSKDADLANNLIKAYFSTSEKMLVETDPVTKEKYEDKTLGKSEHGRKNNRKSVKKGKKGGVSVKVEEKSERSVVEDKCAKLFSALLTGLNRAIPYADLPSDIYLKHLNTLYKITHSTNFNTSVQALVLVQHIVQEQDLDSDRYYRTLYESLLDPRLVNSSKQGIYLNLLYKSMKNDSGNIPRVLAFVKRILLICTQWLNIGVVTGMFYLLMQLSKNTPQILDLMEGVEKRPELVVEKTDHYDDLYDPKKRNPAYSNAGKSCMWEITLFLNHYHPTVAIYASSFLAGTTQPKPDLGLYTLAHFLDRFVYKNAKQKETFKGSSIMQPLARQSDSLLVKATNMKPGELPANTVDWLSKKTSEIRPDEKFFYDYFVHNTHKSKINKNGEQNENGENFDDDDVWNALVQLQPEIERADSDSDIGLDPNDFSDMSDFDDEDLDEGSDADDGEFGSDSDTEMFQAKDDDEIDSDGETKDSDLEIGSKRVGAAEKRKNKRKKILELPTFASIDDYAQYLGSDDEP